MSADRKPAPKRNENWKNPFEGMNPLPSFVDSETNQPIFAENKKAAKEQGYKKPITYRAWKRREQYPREQRKKIQKQQEENNSSAVSLQLQTDSKATKYKRNRLKKRNYNPYRVYVNRETEIVVTGTPLEMQAALDKGEIILKESVRNKYRLDKVTKIESGGRMISLATQKLRQKHSRNINWQNPYQDSTKPKFFDAVTDKPIFAENREAAMAQGYKNLINYRTWVSRQRSKNPADIKMQPPQENNRFSRSSQTGAPSSSTSIAASIPLSQSFASYAPSYPTTQPPSHPLAFSTPALVPLTGQPIALSPFAMAFSGLEFSTFAYPILPSFTTLPLSPYYGPFSNPLYPQPYFPLTTPETNPSGTTASLISTLTPHTSLPQSTPNEAPPISMAPPPTPPSQTENKTTRVTSRTTNPGHPLASGLFSQTAPRPQLITRQSSQSDLETPQLNGGISDLDKSEKEFSKSENNGPD